MKSKLKFTCGLLLRTTACVLGAVNTLVALIALLAVPAARAQSPNLALQNCNKIWGTAYVGPASPTGQMNFFNVSTTPTPGAPASGPTVATTGFNSTGAALAIDARTGYLYVATDLNYIIRYDGITGVGAQVYDIDGAGGNAGATFRYARATIVDGVLLVMENSPTSQTATTSTFTALRFRINQASGALTALPNASITLPGINISGGDVAQDDTTNRVFMVINNLVAGTKYFFEIPANVFTDTGAVAVTGTLLTNGTYLATGALGASSYGGFAIYRGEFYVGANDGSLAKIPTNLASNPVSVSMQTPVVRNTGNASSVDLASCGIPQFNMTKTGQTYQADGTTTAPFAVEGGFIQYTVTVQNVGSTVALGSTFTDLLPAGTTYVANSATLNGSAIAGTANPFDPSRPINTPGQGSGHMGYLTGGNTATITYRVQVNSLTGSLTNTATSAFGTPTASAPPNCTASPPVNCATSTAQASAKLALSKVIAAPGRRNATDQFTVRIRNGSTDVSTATTTGTGTTASTVTVPVALGTAYTLDEVMPSGALSAYNTAIACTNTGGNAATTLPSGSGQNFSITPQAGDEITCTLTNTRIQVADLSITKTNTPGVNGGADQAADTVTAGANTSYTLVVSNAGPDTATGAVVRDEPVSRLTCPAAGLTPEVTCSGAAGACPQPTYTMAQLQAGITLGTLAAGQQATLVMTCTVN